MLSSSAFWKTQHTLRGKDSNLLPAALLIVAGVLVTYRHMTEERWESNALKTFLALIMIQMLPLVLIEVKMPSCSDPLALLARFGSKVLLMHACVLGIRGCYNMLYNDYSFMDTFWFMGACAALCQGFDFRLTRRTVYEHKDVLCLMLLALLTAVIEERISYMTMRPWRRKRYQWSLANYVVPSCNYAEILAFVPAVWMVWQDKSEMSSPCHAADDAKIQMKVKAFFMFLVAFYVYEDLRPVMEMWSEMPLAALGHSAHFLLVLDFAGFMLAHIFNPEKIKEGLMKMRSSLGAGTFV